MNGGRQWRAADFSPRGCSQREGARILGRPRGLKPVALLPEKDLALSYETRLLARMLTFSLQSGSNGNAIYVEAGDVRLLFDAGISGKQAASRMALRNRDIRDCDAVIISHNHSDHVRCAGIYQRKFGLPVYLTQQTYGAA
ncbi:MAG: MBL fold metallo-hydrolase, partial [Planctomycetota bacterium]